MTRHQNLPTGVTAAPARTPATWPHGLLTFRLLVPARSIGVRDWALADISRIHKHLIVKIRTDPPQTPTAALPILSLSGRRPLRPKSALNHSEPIYNSAGYEDEDPRPPQIGNFTGPERNESNQTPSQGRAPDTGKKDINSPDTGKSRIQVEHNVSDRNRNGSGRTANHHHRKLQRQPNLPRNVSIRRKPNKDRCRDGNYRPLESSNGYCR